MPPLALALVLGQPAAHAHGKAARIFTISPACGHPRDMVIIAGNGFGTQNVEMYVGQETAHGVITGGVRAQGERASTLVKRRS